MFYSYGKFVKKEEGRRKKITDCVTDLTEVEKRATDLMDLIIDR